MLVLNCFLIFLVLKHFSFTQFNELYRFLGEIKIDLTVSNSEIIIFNFTASKLEFSLNRLIYWLIK